MSYEPVEPAPHAAIILAGGDGSRLLSLTRFITGADVPKQFCRLDGRSSLLDLTRQRVGLAFRDSETVIVVNQQHRRYYAPAQALFGDTLLLEQSANRGTAPAILHALLRLRQRLPGDAIVTVFPSDHYVANDLAFMRHVAIAERAIQDRPELVVILGIAPSYPEPAYGWIEPAEQIGNSLEEAILRVRSFWEKPPVPIAERLWLSGACWNSFVFSVRIDTLFELMRSAVPALIGAFSPLFDASASTVSTLAAAIYQHLPSIGFSEAVMAKAPRQLAVRPVNDVAWSDLGDPHRVRQTAEAAGWSPPWISRIRRLGPRALAV